MKRFLRSAFKFSFWSVVALLIVGSFVRKDQTPATPTTIALADWVLPVDPIEDKSPPPALGGGLVGAYVANL